MSAKTEWMLVAVLGVAGGGVYYALQQQPPAAVLPASTAVAPAVLTFPEPGDPGAPEELPPPRAELPVLATIGLSEGLPTSGAWRGHSKFADMDADGHLDLLASIRRIDEGTPGEGLYVYRGDGEGHWTPAVNGLRRDMGYGGVDVADVNGDGHLDLAFSGHDVTPHVFVGGDAAGRWLLAWSAYELEGICSDVALGDFDSDGHTDLATIALFSDGDGLVVHKGDGTGAFEAWQVLEPKGAYGQTVDVADLDGDGRTDLMATTSNGVKVWSFTTDGGWQSRSDGLPTPRVGGSDLGMIAVDLDADGSKELVLAGMIYPGHPPLGAWRWDGSAWKTWGHGLPDGEGFFDIALANLGPNAPISLVANGKFGVQLIQLAGPEEFVSRGRLEGTENLLNVTCGDVDGDGRDEVMCVGFSGVSVLKLSEEALAAGGAGGRP